MEGVRVPLISQLRASYPGMACKAQVRVLSPFLSLSLSQRSPLFFLFFFWVGGGGGGLLNGQVAQTNDL